MATRRRTTKAADTAPVVLHGAPTRLDATVTVQNTTDVPITVRSATVRGEGVPTTTSRIAARLPAGSTGAVPVNVSLPATTAPGSYAVELEVAGVSHPARLDVEPALDLAITPQRVLAGPGKQPFAVRIVNRGNVSVPVAARLQARVWTNGVVSDLDVGATLDEPLTVEPGTAVDATGTLLVPDDLDPTRRHQARLPIGIATLVVLVLPRDEKPTTARKKR